MKKPSPMKTVTHPYTGMTARVPTYMTTWALHTAMKEWAESQAKFTVQCGIVCDDGSRDDDFHTFERMTKDVTYTDPYEKQEYEVQVDTGKFDASLYADYIEGYDEEKGATRSQCIAALRARVNSDPAASTVLVTATNIQP